MGNDLVCSEEYTGCWSEEDLSDGKREARSHEATFGPILQMVKSLML